MVRNVALSVEVSDAERQILGKVVEAMRHGHLQVVDEAGQTTPFVPDLENRILKIFRLLHERRALDVLPHDEELSPNEAAEHLNVSRTFVNKLIERNELHCHMVGSHKRIQLSDVLAYKERMMSRREDGLAAIARLSEKQGGESDDAY